jgi:hypothetical protein
MSGRIRMLLRMRRSPAGLGDDFRATIHEKVALYQTGPQQLTLPDAQLKKGTLVRLIRKELGYSLVQTAPGNQLGWVANEDLGVAPVGGYVNDAELAGPSPSLQLPGQQSPRIRGTIQTRRSSGDIRLSIRIIWLRPGVEKRGSDSSRHCDLRRRRLIF